MAASWYDLQHFQQVLWAKAPGIKRRTSLDLPKTTWIASIWSEEHDEEMTLPSPDTPLLYSLHY